MAEKDINTGSHAFAKKSDTELTKMLGEKREEERHLRFGVAGSATRDVRAVRTNKREIAQILTELNARHQRTAASKQDAKEASTA